MVTYIATVHQELDSDYGVQFYDFPGCISVGTSIEEGKAMATEALTGHLMLMLADGDQIPQPSNLETIVTDVDQKDAVAFLLIDIPNSVFIETTKQAIAL
jgi:predicted RNase H-like HicB family nuclease